MVKIEINGIPLEVERGAMVIEAADRAGIRIPRFCYHKKLSVAANCRMCLVELEKAPKPVPAYATPVSDGMKIHTASPRAIAAQKSVMEFLLINHPLDCPICDQGGECELQDVAMGYGGDVSRFNEGKRVVQDKDIGPLIATDMTRCIHCTRCVRFGDEIAGMRELGATGRGEHTEIGTYVASTVVSEMSGNVIDLCPVGALTAKPFRFRARAWELRQHDGVAPHDCIGSNIHLHTRRGEVMRVVPRENEAVNEVWISDRDRFSYEAVNSPERLTRPLVRGSDGQWSEVDWDTALAAAAEGLQRVASAHGPAGIGAWLSPSATAEELYLAQALMRGVGSHNIDHRLRQASFADQEQTSLFPWLGHSLEDLEELDAALVVGSNLRKEQPLLAHRLRKAALKGGRVAFLNAVQYPLHFPATHSIQASPARYVRVLAGIARALLDSGAVNTHDDLGRLLADVEPSAAERAVAAALKEAQRGTVLLGQQALAHPDLPALRCLASAISELAGTGFGYLTDGANSAGAWLAGAVPHRLPGGKVPGSPGLDARAMRDGGVKGFVLLGVEPGLDCDAPGSARAALKRAEFVLSLSSFDSPDLRDTAHVILPVATFAETPGTFVNAEGRWQSFASAALPKGDSRPAWKVLRVLGNLLNLDGFDYLSAEEVLRELRAQVGTPAPSNKLVWRCPESLGGPGDGLVRVGEVPMYALDPLVRRAPALQRTPDAAVAVVRLHPDTVERLGLAGADRVTVRQAQGSAVLALEPDPRLPRDVAWVPAGLAATVELGGAFAAIELQPAAAAAAPQA